MSDFLEKTYSKILSITLMHFAKPISTAAIFEEGAHRLETSRCFQASGPIELAHAMRQFWDEHINHKCEPKVLCINHHAAFGDHHKALLMFGIVGATIEEQFKAQLLIRTKQKFTNEQHGTRVFQRFTHPPCHAPETNFFPAETMLSSSKH